MNLTHRSVAVGLLLALVPGCGKGDDGAAAAAAAEKQAHEQAITDLKQPVALISAYSPYARYPENPDKFWPPRHPDLEKSTLAASNEVRYAANRARQKLEVVSGNATKDLQDALRVVTTGCADAVDPDMLKKCTAAIDGLDAALAKTGAAAAALGVTGKYPRIAPESVTDEAKAAIAPFLRARGPGANDKTYVDKRNDPKASVDDVIAACQAAQGDAAGAAQAFEKADEPIRLTAATRKMALDSQCRRLGELQSLAKDLNDCRKKATTTACKIVCGKVQNWIDEGLPAAAFANVTKDQADVCGKP